MRNPFRTTPDIRDDFVRIRTALEELLAKRNVLREEVGLSEQVVALKKRIAELEIQEAKLKEANAREDRELRHMIGLEKKRQEFEIESAKREAVLTVREENLEADRQRFADEMKFQGDRFEKEVGYLKDLMGQVLERLPNVSVVQRSVKGDDD